MTRLALFQIVLLAGCAAEPPAREAEAEPEPAAEEAAAPAEPEGDPYVTLHTKEGEIEIRLRPDLAPNTVENFLALAKRGFYYNTLFHRVIPDTLIQGGDPNSKDNDPYNDGFGNTGTFLPAEFSKAPFQRGTVAMARGPDPHSASSQFFICLRRMAQWDGNYTVFGEVTKGIEVVEKMSKAPRSQNPRLSERPAGNLWIRDVDVEYRPAPSGE